MLEEAVDNLTDNWFHQLQPYSLSPASVSSPSLSNEPKLQGNYRSVFIFVFLPLIF